ncbi:MAG: hypothetical protein KAS54_01750, partial [Dehalococcoidia bacterium]|nr:hypothetical protein [Dehalococcoidia bacterium]
ENRQKYIVRPRVRPSSVFSFPTSPPHRRAMPFKGGGCIPCGFHSGTGHPCAVIFLDESNPKDAVVASVYT